MFVWAVLTFLYQMAERKKEGRKIELRKMERRKKGHIPLLDLAASLQVKMVVFSYARPLPLLLAPGYVASRSRIAAEPPPLRPPASDLLSNSSLKQHRKVEHRYHHHRCDRRF